MWINSLLSIISKDIKIFTRSKLSAFVIILAPLLIILFAGQAFNSNDISNVNVATYSESYTSRTENLLNYFKAEGFLTTKFNSINECIDSVKLTDSQICILFPKDLSELGTGEEVIFYVDYSRINLAYTLIHKIESSISLESSEMGIVLANDLIKILESTKTDLPEHNKEISSSISKLKENNELIDNVDLSLKVIDDSIDLLTDAKDSLNDSGAKDNIIDTISKLEILKEDLTSDSEDIDTFKKENEEIYSNLKTISSNLEDTIDSLNSQQVVKAENIVSPIKIKIESIKDGTNNRDYIIPTLLSLIALFGGMLLSSTLVLKEKKTKAYFRNFITPTKDFTFIVGTYLTTLMIVLLQFILIFAGIKWVLKINIFSMHSEIILILFLSVTVFILFGMFIGYLFRSEETIIFGSVLISALLMFFSNIILPLENISGNLKKFAMFNPLVVTDIALKKTILFGLNYSSLLNEILILSSFAVAFLVLTYVFRRITRRIL